MSAMMGMPSPMRRATANRICVEMRVLTIGCSGWNGLSQLALLRFHHPRAVESIGRVIELELDKHLVVVFPIVISVNAKLQPIVVFLKMQFDRE